MRRALLHGLVSILTVISLLCLAAMAANVQVTAKNDMASLSISSTTSSYAPNTIVSDFYAAYPNANGTLSFASKDMNSIIVDHAASFYLNYGKTSSTDVSPNNSSFEFDANSDGIPDGWSVNSPYIYQSADYASNGTKSIKFYSTSPDSDHRTAYSSLIPINGKDKSYSISIDSLYSSFTSGIGYAAIAVVYSNTSDGSGTLTVSDTLTRVGQNIGSWSTNNLTWNAPFGAQSFEVMLYIDKGDVSTVYFDNLKVTEISYLYDTNGSSINSSISTSGDNITVLSTDDSNPEVTVTNRYDLNVHSPNVSYSTTLTYKQNVTVSEERFDFTVPTQTVLVMNRGLQMVTYNTVQEYYSDLYTPKVVKFGNGVFWSGTDTMQSMRLRASGSNSQLSFYSDYFLNHPYFYYVKNGDNTMVDISAQKRKSGDSYTASVVFAVNPGSTPLFLVKARQPFGYDATLVMTNHPDNEALGPVNAVAYGTEDTSSPAYGTMGIVGRKLGWTKAIFLSGQPSPYMDLPNPTFKALTDKMFHDGVEIIAHSITPFTDSRDVVDAGMQQLSAQYGARNWIDHGAAEGGSNWEDLASQGTVRGDPNYTLDLFAKYGYDYAWSYIDFRVSGHSLNFLANVQGINNTYSPTTLALNSSTSPALNTLSLSNTDKITPFFYYNNNVDDNPGHDNKIYLWSTIFTDDTPDLYYTTSNVDDLIAQRGVHIEHEYDGLSNAQNHAWYTNSATGKIEIYPTFDNELAYMAAKRDAGLLWVPTMTQFGDFLRLLPNVSVINNQNGTYSVTNSNSYVINGLTLLSESTLTSVIMDETPLTSFGGAYGPNELVIPSLNPGQTVVLSINNPGASLSVTTYSATSIAHEDAVHRSPYSMGLQAEFELRDFPGLVIGQQPIVGVAAIVAVEHDAHILVD